MIIINIDFLHFLYVQWNPLIVARLNKGQPLNKDQMTTTQACYF